MRKLGLLLLALACLTSCARPEQRTELVLQRFFGECGAVYGHTTDVAKAETECGILTTLINKFQADNPDLKVSVNVVAWPGYAQLSAQIAAGDPPDLVTMHQSVVSDYAGRGLLEPMEGVLRQAGIAADDFTEAGRMGVTKRGRIYAMPWDTIGRLWHINTKLMAKAGLMRGSQPMLPDSPQQLLQYARQFRAATGLPYLLQAQVSAPDYYAANLYTYMLAQNAVMFPDPRHVLLNTPEARAIVELYRTLNQEGLTRRNQDFPAATASFMNGEGGIFPTGTWMIGPYDAEAQTRGRPLSGNYAVLPFPRLWGRDAAFVDGHSWIIPKHARSPERLSGIARFLRFMAANNYQWTRTGQLPAFKAVLAMPQFRALPHRSDIAAMAATGGQLPDYVQRQSAIQGLIGEELEAAINGIKPVDRALSDAERRVDEVLAEVQSAGE